jgi:3-oxoadipate enol-lactonase / 4-carboxymuconolactone decarboxylase
MAADLEGYRRQGRATLGFDVRERLGEIAVPTTVIHGERDATIPSAIAHVTAAGIAGAELRILEGQGHL